MQDSRRSTASSLLSRARASLGFALLAALVLAAPAAAQLTPQAYYPLTSNVNDATGMNGPMMLNGNPTPPSAPANGVCVNGIYAYNPNGQDARTPIISTVNTNDLQVDVEFQIAQLPTGFQAPVLMCGRLYRWLGIYVQPSGILGLKYNNSNYTWSTTTVSAGNWYLGSIRYENGTVELHLDGHMILQTVIGPLTTGGNLDFTTNDFANGSSLYGCIRNLVISNDTTLSPGASATVYGTSCDGVKMGANGVPHLGNSTFALQLSNVPSISPIVFFGFGLNLVDPGADLTPIGMAGCFSYTSLDVGTYPAPVMSGAGSFTLPIPNLPTLTGAVLYAQGVSLSSTTSLGLASSNAVQLVLGT